MTKSVHGTCMFLMRSTFRKISTVGQWLLISHKRFGRKIRKEINPPSQIAGLRSHERYRVINIERKKAAPKMSVECLFRIPKPATRPNHSHKRGFPVRTMRIEMHTHSIQNSGSNAFMDKKLSIVR